MESNTERYSKGHERDENRRMNKAIRHSLFGLLLCWLPFIGLLFSISGFLRVVVRVTRAHRVKKVFCTFLSLIVLVVCLAAFGAELYFYSRDPSILNTYVHKAWYALTGEEQMPWLEGGDSSNAGYGLEPEDPYANYGYDAYENDAEPGDEDGYDFDAEYDEDFDDTYLKDFDAYMKGGDDTEEENTADSQTALFDDMLSSGKLSAIHR